MSKKSPKPPLPDLIVPLAQPRPEGVLVDGPSELPSGLSPDHGSRILVRSAMTNPNERQHAPHDEVTLDLRKLTMTARGRGLEYIGPLALILSLGLVVSLAMLSVMVHVAAGHSPAVISFFERTIARL